MRKPIREKPIRVVIVDDDDLRCQRLQILLELVEGMEIVGNYASAEEAFPQMSRLLPDVVLMDAQMQGMSGIEATRYLKRNGMHCGAEVIILAESMDYMISALEAGAAAYLPNNVKCTELIDAIRQVYQSRHSLEDNGEVVNKVELALSPIADADLIVNFTNQVKETFHADILKTVGSSNWGTAVTIVLKPTQLTNLMDELMNMPEVEKVEAPVRHGFPGHFKKLAGLLRSRANHSKRIQVTLKETLMMGQCAAALN